VPPLLPTSTSSRRQRDHDHDLEATVQTHLLMDTLWTLFATTAVFTAGIAIGIRLGFRRGKGVRDL
jgi:hypothetical protein